MLGPSLRIQNKLEYPPPPLEPQNTNSHKTSSHKTPKRQLKQINQLSLTRQETGILANSENPNENAVLSFLSK